MHTSVCAAAVCAAIFTFSVTAQAGPADYVHTPIVEQGEREIDFKFGTEKERAGERSSVTTLGFGYGLTAWWFTELYGKWHRESPEGWRYDAVEWENKFQLTETGKYPLDVGFLIEIERPKDHDEGWEVKWGPLLQTELTSVVQANFNVLFERHYRAVEKSETEMGYQWQVKYRWQPKLEFGVQGLGEFGEWDQWHPIAEQEHKLGPVVFGKFGGQAHHQAVKYNAAWLLGANNNTSRNTFRLQVEYEF